jgi:predicted Zn-dependent protease
MGNSERRDQLAALLRDDPHDAFLRYALAMELVAAGDKPNALAQLQMLLTHTPDYVPGYLQAGKLAAELGRDADARIFFTQGIEQARKQGETHAAEEMTGMLVGLA